MPYITQEDRAALDTKKRNPETAGELNYAITQLCVRYYLQNGARYQQINDVVGALDCAAKEFYRRIAEPYEDDKRRVNGDVYPAKRSTSGSVPPAHRDVP